MSVTDKDAIHLFRNREYVPEGGTRESPAVLDEAICFIVILFFVSASRIAKIGVDASARAPRQRAPIAVSCRFAEIGP